MITSVSLVSPTDNGFVVDTGSTGSILVQGKLRLALEVDSSDLVIPNLSALVTVRGVVRSGGSESELVNVISVAYDSATSGSILLKPSFLISFTVDLGTNGLVPSHGRHVEYTVHAAVSYSLAGASIEKLIEAIAPLVVLPDEQLRALVLATQAPLLIANGDDSNTSNQINQDEYVNFVITVARRAVLAGDEFVAELNIASSKMHINKVVLSLQARTTEHAIDEDIPGPLETLASIEDVSLTDDHKVMALMK
ncbi:hypothetical protein HDU99_005765, partial [Rhizoclosmatium hyalinum]